MEYRLKTQHEEEYNRITIGPGEYYAANRRVLITTVLGSCVSACLYDPVNNIVGMNHFLLSSRRYARDLPFCITDAGRYGIHSMELLINAILKKGANRSNIKAKAFGGGSVIKALNSSPTNYFAVGEVNKKFILEFLKEESIPLVSSDLGGHVARVIYFDSRDFSVYVRKMKEIKPHLITREQEYWKKSIQKHEETEMQVDLW